MKHALPTDPLDELMDKMIEDKRGIDLILLLNQADHLRDKLCNNCPYKNPDVSADDILIWKFKIGLITKVIIACKKLLSFTSSKVSMEGENNEEE